VTIVPAVMLSASGVIVAAAAFLHRGDPAWQRGMVWIMGLAIAQVLLGVASALLFAKA
jgi:hypothetical protein